MRILWRTSLPLVGLALFAMITYQSVGENRKFNQRETAHAGSAKYFWWSYIRLDSDPTHEPTPKSVCTDNPGHSKDCILVEPLAIWIDPGLFVKALIVAAAPAFFASIAIVRAFGRIGVDEVWTFMISTPILICLWFYFIGWLLDRRCKKKQLSP